jgi:hypothetical protein
MRLHVISGSIEREPVYATQLEISRQRSGELRMGDGWLRDIHFKGVIMR